ncbi:MAG: hypothetical protein QXI10_01130 [Candidatus Diapherotrites archaeon]
MGEKMEEKTQPNDKGIIRVIDKLIANKEEPNIEEFMPKLKKGGKEKIKELKLTSELEKSALENSKENEKKEVGKTFLIFLKSKEYQKSLIWILKGITKNYEKIIYVTLNNTKNSLVAKLEEENIVTNKFFFIDAISLTTEEKKEEEQNCAYVSSPQALVEMSLTLSNVFAMQDKQQKKALIFDSVSTLLDNENETNVSKFVHSITTKTKSNNIDAYFFALNEDMEKKTLKEIGLFMDETTSYEENTQEKVVNKQTFVPHLSDLINEIEAMHREIDENRYERGLKERLEEIKQRLELLEEIKDKMRKLEFSNEKEKENYEELSESINEIKSKISKTESINLLEEKILQLYRKIEEHDEKTQLGEELRKSIEAQKNNEFKNSMEEIKEKLKQLENIDLLKEELNSLEKRIEDTQEMLEKSFEDKETKESETINELTKQVHEIAKKVDEAKKSEKIDFSLEPINKELEELKDKIDRHAANYEELLKDSETKAKAMGFLITEVKEKLNKLEKIADIEKNINELEKKFEEQVKQLQNYEENLMQIKTKVGNFDKLFEEMGYVRSKIEETQKELANIMKFPERITESEEKEKQEIEELKEKLIDTEMITQQKINEILESDKRTQNQLFDLMKMPEKIAQIRTKEDAEIESIKESEKQIETKISEILEKEKRKDEIEKERLEMNLKMLNKIEELESTLSKLEKRLEISELERMLEESDSELKELNHEKEVVKEALMKLSDPNYSNEKSTELKDTLENIQNAEKTIMNKMKEITKRIEVLKEEKNAN